MSKRGSALLIALGVVAFLAASVTAFAVYMRESRLPSSYFRRALAERQFAKAGLAHAIDEIDAAIGNDPFPGVGPNATVAQQQAQSVPFGQNAAAPAARWGSDAWCGRVLTPYDLCTWSNAVTVLTLEGLGYLPPSILNEVRFWSRQTTNALWRSFNYDIGRYAFVAVNVSDFLDLNKLRANTNRTVASPISLAYLFADDLGNVEDGDVREFDKFLVNRGGEYPGVPFSSMMDYNLATLGDTTPAMIKNASPFACKMTGRIDGSDSWYAKLASNEVVRQSFVTDTWFPASNGQWRVRLEDPGQQPFAQCGKWFPGESPAQTSFQHCYEDIAASHPFWGPYNTTFPIITTGLLCDYLDFDDVPLSLAMPCAENAPMVVGVELAGHFDFRIGTKKSKVDGGPTKPGEQAADIYEYEHKLCMSVLPDVMITCAYPFRRMADRLKTKKFYAECCVRLFFTEDQGAAWTQPLRLPTTSPGNETARLKFKDDPFIWPNNAYEGLGQQTDGPKSHITFVSNKVALQLPDEVTAVEEDCFCKLGAETAIPFDFRQYDTGMSPRGDMGLTLVKYQWNETDGKLVAPVDDGGNLADSAYDQAFRFYKGDWTFARFGDTVNLKPSVAVWVRISDQDNATVDLVPAHVNMDSINGHNNVEALMYGINQTCGADTPLLRFLGSDVGLQFNRTRLMELSVENGNRSSTMEQKCYYCCDPRYNYAPEDWVAFSEKDFRDPKDLWLEGARAIMAKDFRDRDVFMFVSNQGYLQSPYELMFIPRLGALTGGSDPDWGDLAGADYDGKIRKAVDELANEPRMWRSYLVPSLGGEDDLDALRMGPCGPDNVFRVNPYGSPHFTLAAIANTPYDWWAAGTNNSNVVNAKDRSLKTQQLRNDDDERFHCAFCPQSADGASQWTKGEMASLANWLSAEFIRAGNANGDWLAQYDSFDWGGVAPSAGGSGQGGGGQLTGNDPLSIFGSDICFGDRKYLYGFWRNCFANRQQLFLVFVRVESNTTSSNDAARRGTRAVALVWRDPTPPNPPNNVAGTGGDMSSIYLHENGTGPNSWRTIDRPAAPHRTRILFYHQFD